jgi:hypothetical protein
MTKIKRSVEIKRPTRCNRWFFIAKLIVCSTCFGHQELKSIIQVVAACGTWCFGLQFVGLVWNCRLCVPSTTGSNHLYNILELLMMGKMVPKTCWANNKFCNKEPSVASSWSFYFHVLTTMHGQTHIKFIKRGILQSFVETSLQRTRIT